MKPVHAFYSDNPQPFKNVPNISLKGNTFDASHLDAFIMNDEVSSIFNYFANKC